MALKRPLFFAIARRNFGEPEIVAVTTVKTGRGGWHGRTISDNVGTHGAHRDLLSRHNTQEEAELHLTSVRGVRAHFRRVAELMNRAHREQHAAEEHALEQVCRGESPMLPDWRIVRS